MNWWEQGKPLEWGVGVSVIRALLRWDAGAGGEMLRLVWDPVSGGDIKGKDWRIFS